MNRLPTAAAPKKGRPASKTRSEVADKLLAAAERLMREHGYLPTTEKMIATAAGVHEKMIHYYFGSKEQLLSDIVDCYSQSIADGFEMLRTTSAWHKDNPTRHIVAVLTNIYYAKPWLGRIIMSEVSKGNSIVKDQFLKRYGPQGLVGLKGLFDQLVKSGVYDRNANTTYASISLYSTLVAPLIVTQVSSALHIDLDDFSKESWIDYLADLYDRQLRASTFNGASK